MKKYLKSALQLVLASTFSLNALACGGFTHMYIAMQSIPKMKDQDLVSILNKYPDDYKRGANFPDVGYVPNANYGEAAHWDPFLHAFERYLTSHYKNPIQDPQAQPLVAFLLGVATHRVSDDIWHNHEDSVDPAYKSKYPHAQYPFSNCQKTDTNPCYYGTISKIADVEALDWDGPEQAHSIADRGIEYAVIDDKNLSPDNFAPHDWTMPAKVLSVVFQDQEVQDWYKKTTNNPNANLVVTEQDINNDTITYKDLAIVGIYALAQAGGLGFLEKRHKMDWIRYNYENDPDVGLVPIEGQVAKFLDNMPASLRTNITLRSSTSKAGSHI